MKLEFSRQTFVVYSNTKFHENQSSGSRRTDMTKPWKIYRTGLTLQWAYSPRIPCKISSAQGSKRNMSHEGNGIWRKKPNLQCRSESSVA